MRSPAVRPSCALFDFQSAIPGTRQRLLSGAGSPRSEIIYMAGFRMHVSTSAVLGCGYAGVLYAGYGVSPETAVVSGAMCGFSGMLADLDSDYGVAARNAMCLTEVTVAVELR